MKVVVTGGAGFIGAHTCRALAAAGHEVVALDDLSTGCADNLDGIDATLVEGSILDAGALDDVLVGAGAVVHLAARSSVPRSIADPVSAHRVNTGGTLEVLEAVRRAGETHVVVASSSSVYGANTTLPKSEDLVPMPMTPYAATKLATESYTFAHAHVFGLDALVLRFFNVFGPFQPAGHAYAAAVPAFIDAALAGRPLPVQGDGRQTRDFTYVGSVADALVEAVGRRVTSDRPVNLAFGSRVSVLELIAVLGRILGRDLPLDHGPARLGDMRDTQADTSRLRALFPGIEPVDLETGLRETVAWFRSAAR